MVPQVLTIDAIPPAVLEVLTGLQAAGHRAFLVGGCVRDLLRGEHPKDFDIATSATPVEVQSCFRRVLPTGIDHGTVTVVMGGHHHVEVTTFRSEAEYLDGRRPSKVEFEREVDADLARRDFTINAMAWDPTTPRFVDPFGGQADLAARTVRCVRNAHERFSEDGLRALRAVRFATVLAFTIDPETERAIEPTLPIFRKVALERVHQEFIKLLVAPMAAHGLRLLSRTGLLAAFFPEADVGQADAVGRASADPEVRMALLLVAERGVREALLRLKCANRFADEVAHLVRHQMLPVPAASDSGLRRWLAQVGPSHLEQLLALNAARGREVGVVGARLSAIVASKPPLTARDLSIDGRGIMETLGVGPSPLVGVATRFLLEVVLDAPERNTKDELVEALRRQFAVRPPNHTGFRTGH